MAEVSLSITVNTDDTATLVDGTTFTSPARSGVGVFVKVYKVNASSVRTAVIATGDTSDPETDASWDFPIASDGWYQIDYVAIPDYNVGTTYAQYDAVFDPSTNLVYKSVGGGNIGQSLASTIHWTLVTDPTTLAAFEDTATESANIDSLVYNSIILNHVTEYRGDKALEAAQEGASALEEPTDSSWYFSIADFNFEAARIAEVRQQYAAAERYVRRMDELATF